LAAAADGLADAGDEGVAGTVAVATFQESHVVPSDPIPMKTKHPGQIPVELICWKMVILLVTPSL